MESSSSPLPANLPSRGSIDEITEDTETDNLVRVLSFPSAPLNQQRRRRGGSSKTAPFAARPSRQQSFGREIGHAAAETYLLTRLSFKLLSYLGYHSYFSVSCSLFSISRLILCFFASVLLIMIVTSNLSHCVIILVGNKLNFWILVVGLEQTCSGIQEYLILLYNSI